ncbi:hypothetical protein Arub01_54540 [Actinomadura rubrobrunea]|uniref:DUF732 domain-containing protein n=1 Tax=Actinomadura rubrobrunea TaxID=115335 RepID=A0A9W6Q1U1_9ACTN|nr:hypothetical protein [Actinomadura rubrobrunea]GLW67211.1 hypothetical protein Arub01_54540 [Actinomadura rubrobrunea]
MTHATVRRHATALLLVPALALTACGGEDGEGGDTAPLPVASTSPGTAPSPAASSPTSLPETAASTAAATPGGRAAGQVSRRPAAPTVTPSAYRTLASCLERHGVDLPDPGQATAPPPGFDPFKAQEALKKCMKDLEKPRGASAPR